MSVSSVTDPRCETRKIPSKNFAVCGGPPLEASEVNSTTPFFVSIVEPIGIDSPACSGRQRWRGRHTSTVPETGLTTTVRLNCGTGVGVGVGPVGAGMGVGVGPGGCG